MRGEGGREGVKERERETERGTERERERERERGVRDKLEDFAHLHKTRLPPTFTETRSL